MFANVIQISGHTQSNHCQWCGVGVGVGAGAGASSGVGVGAGAGVGVGMGVIKREEGGGGSTQGCAIGEQFDAAWRTVTRPASNGQ